MKPLYKLEEKHSALLITLILMILLSMTAAGYLYFQGQKEEVKKYMRQELMTIAALKQAQISQWLKERKADCEVIKNNPQTAFRFYNFLQKKNTSAGSELKLWMKSRLNSYNYENIFFFDHHKKLVLREGATEETNFTDKFYSFLEQADKSGEIVFSDLYETGENGDYDLDYFIPLSLSRDNEMRAGFIVLRTDPKNFLYTVITVDKFNQSSLENILYEINDARVNILSPLPDFKRSISNGQSTALIATDRDTVIEGFDYDNNAVIAASVKIQGSPWYLVSQIDQNEIYSVLDQQEMMVLIISGLVVIAAFIGIGFIWRDRQAKFYKQLYEQHTETKTLELRLDYLVKYANDIIMVTNSEGQIIEVNDAAGRFYQYTRDELYLMKYNTLRAPGYKIASISNYFEEIEKRNGKVYESLHARKDGTVVPVEVSARVIEKNGRVFLQQIIRDITDRKEAELGMKRLNRLYEITGAINKVITRNHVLDEMLDEICRVTAEAGKFRLCWIGRVSGDEIIPAAWAGTEEGYLSNPGFTAGNNPTGNGPAGKSVRSRKVEYSNDIAQDPQMGPWVSEALKRNLNSVASVPLITDNEVSGVFVVYSSEKIYFNTSELKLLEGAGQDIAFAIRRIKDEEEKERINNELKKNEAEIKNLNENLERRIRARTAQLEAANRELETFSYSVSHDLRAPLRTIEGFSEALIQDYGNSLDETGLSYLNQLRKGSRQMSRLIDDLLTLSRVTRKAIVKRDINLSEMAASISEEMKKNDPDRNVEFIIEPGVHVKADETLMQAALYNLLENAYKFTSKKEEAVIKFGRHRSDGIEIYFVKDNGAGFDPKYGTKLFAPFQRLHSYDEFPGTGIGLANVHRIISRHQGKIWVEAELNKGAAFYFTLEEMEDRETNET